jgi:hypothetical protein
VSALFWRERGAYLFVLFIFLHRSTTFCSMSTIEVSNDAQLLVLEGQNWVIGRAIVSYNGNLSFRQSANKFRETFRLPGDQPTNVTIAQGWGNLDFQGTYTAFLGQFGWYFPGYPDIYGERFVLNKLTYVCVQPSFLNLRLIRINIINDQHIVIFVLVQWPD